ncbi:SMI1/KNR4 family protein [Streptomyces sp. NPDC050095]|uniref:SMI1/KNR4 family protein n=1 Tax=unclassified Streptomyces TaxID=2593676 RepID=UPI00341BF5F8
MDALVRPVVEAIVAEGPDGWTDAVLHARAGRGGISLRGGYSARGVRLTRALLPNPFAEVGRLGQVLGSAYGWEPVSFELRCTPSGAYRFVAFDDTVTYENGVRGGGFQVVLDPAYRLPQPGERQEAGTAGPAGDPGLAVARMRELLARRAALLGRPDELPPPAPESVLLDAERRIGRPLPADLRALYGQVADGDGETGVFRDGAWLPLDGLVAEATDGVWGDGRPWFGWDLEWNAVVLDAVPGDTVRRCGGHQGWLPFLTHYDGNFVSADTAPARDGRPGQLIGTGRDHDGGPTHIADSVTSLLGHYLELLDQGAYELEETDAQGGGGGRLWLRERHPESQEASAVQQIVGDIPDEVPATLQAIHINNQSEPVDLAPLAAAPALRLLHLNRSTALGLTPVRALPVESLRVTLADGDLSALEGHPHLAALDVTCAAPMDVAVLRTLPELRGLDLSDADARRLPALGELSGLRYLALGAAQWAELLDEGKAPAGLAAAKLAGADVTFEEALRWAARLGQDTGGALVVVSGD